jgi:hypothetical protein
MYDRFSEQDVRRLVEQVRREFPGWSKRVPIRVAQPPADLVFGVVPGVGAHGLTTEGQEVLVNAQLTPEWQGRTCAICRQPFAVLDHWERRRNGPSVHRRCVAPAGQIARWVPKATISQWLYRAGATYAGPTVTPDVDLEMVITDLGPQYASKVTASNRGLLYAPDGSEIRTNTMPAMSRS